MSNISERKRQARTNILISLIYQVVAAVISLILPRFVLYTFGSDVNGVLQSINQLLSYTVILECGIGGVVTAAFYKPLAVGDDEAISDIFNSTKSFFGKISAVFIALMIVLSLFAKVIINTDYDALYVGSLVLILGINNYFSYYFGLTHQVLIKADQKIRIVQSIQALTLILNAVICIIAMKMNAGIHAVKLISAFVFLLNPIVYRCYVKKHYNISKKIFDSNRKLPQKRDGIAHHIAYFIHRNTDIVILSLFCGVLEVSVYSVYNAIVMAAENFLNAVSNGISGAIGNIIAKDEKNVLDDSFEIYEAVNTFITTFFSTAAAVLIVPFVTVYTQGVEDTNYIRPLFAYLMIAAQWLYCIRMPYGNVIFAAGHYKETKHGAYMEVLLNIGISLLLVKHLGLCGVAVGTLIAMLSRTVYIAWYLSKNILKRKFYLFIKNSGLNFLISICTVYILERNFEISTDSFLAWSIDAALVSIIVLVVLAAHGMLINRKIYIKLLKKLNIWRKSDE